MSGPGPSLGGRVIALSLSPPGDGARLGYPDAEFDRMCFDLTLQIVRAGGRVLYGGHLHENSLTLPIFEHASAAFRTRCVGATPFLHFLPWHELGKTRFDQLVMTLRLFGTFAEIRVLPGTGEQIRLWLATDMANPPVIVAEDATAPRGERRIADQQALTAFHDSRTISEAQSLAVMREAQRQAAEARIVLGGKRGDLGLREHHLVREKANDGREKQADPDEQVDRFGGKMPGICEEVLVSLEAPQPQPIAIAAAFGGAARDTAIWLGLLPKKDAVPYLGEKQHGVDDARKRLTAVRDRLRGDRDVLSDFARRDDSETLAREMVCWIAGELG